MGVRTRCRKALLQARYASEQSGRPLPESMETMRLLLGDPDLRIGAPLSNEDWNWTLELGLVVAGNREEIDARISVLLQNYSLERLSVLTRLILEQAAGEMWHLDPPTPPAVAMDEAIELARDFDSEEAAGFVNGVLDNMAAQSEPGPKG
jgi:transcription antitermination protein NusB